MTRSGQLGQHSYARIDGGRNPGSMGAWVLRIRPSKSFLTRVGFACPRSSYGQTHAHGVHDDQRRSFITRRYLGPARPFVAKHEGHGLIELANMDIRNDFNHAVPLVRQQRP